jgi:hypothetical protein
MTANPLLNAGPRQVSRNLDDYCHWLNGLNFVRSGAPYFIAERDTPNGGIERYLSR